MSAATPTRPQRIDVSARRANLPPGAVAWLVTVPCALVAIAAVVLLGPPLAGVAFPAHPSFTFWPGTYVHHQPVEQTRYLIAVTAPLLLSAAIGGACRLRPRLDPRVMAAAVGSMQLLVVGLLVACFVGQHQPRWARHYFSTGTLVAAGVIAIALVAAARSASLRPHLAALLRPSRGRWAAAFGVAALVTAVSVLPGVDSDTSIAWSVEVTNYHVAFPFDEAFAVINGLTPLVDFTAQYGNLWPYLSAVALLLFGKTLLVYTIAMCTLTIVTMLSIFGVLRRVTASPLATLLLFLPFVATSFFIVRGTYAHRFSFATYFGAFPLRHAGPYLLAYLTARQLDRRTPKALWPLFAVGGLVLVNNSDFGLAAVGASIAAFVWADVATRRRSLARLAVNVGGGIAAALALVTAIALVRTGALPQPARLVEYARIYTVGGFSLIPIPGLLGLPLIIFGTYVAAVGTATVRALDGEPNRVLTGMLVWSGVFGLGSAAYYVARSHPDVLPLTFSAWSLTLALLTVVVLGRLAADRPRLPSLAMLAVLVGIGAVACSVVQTPTPWTEVERVSSPPGDSPAATEAGSERPAPLVPPSDPQVRRFVSSLADGPHRFVVRPGAPVAILATNGHRIADAYGVRDVVPYTGAESISTREQFQRTIDVLQAAGGNTVLIPSVVRLEMFDALARRGFEPLTAAGLRPWSRDTQAQQPVVQGDLMKWVDIHHLHPAALG